MEGFNLQITCGFYKMTEILPMTLEKKGRLCEVKLKLKTCAGNYLPLVQTCSVTLCSNSLNEWQCVA